MTALHQQLTRSLYDLGVRPVEVTAARTLANVLLEIQTVGPIIWRNLPVSEEAEVAALDRLDDLQAEARAMIESLTGCSWDAIQTANL